MKLKIFKVIFNGENGVDVSLHTSAEGAVTAATKIAQTENDLAEVVLHAKQRELADLLGPVEVWPDQNWLTLWAKITEGLTLGINTITIEAEEVTFTPKVKPMYGFDGDFVGAIDINPQLPRIKTIFPVIASFADRRDNQSDDTESCFYLCDKAAMMDNIPNDVWDSLSPMVKANLQLLFHFLEENNVWWVRFPIW